MKNFELLLSTLKKFKLPAQKFMIVGGGCLAVNNLRDCVDIDLICDKKLWEELGFKYGITDKKTYKVIKLGNKIEVLGLGSVYLPEGFKTYDNLLYTAKTINNVLYAPLEFVKQVKLKLGREKDILDVQLIDEYLGTYTII